jgi:ubiquinone/menaquinone biosynthesis C-methylase UbiE
LWLCRPANPSGLNATGRTPLPHEPPGETFTRKEGALFPRKSSDDSRIAALYDSYRASASKQRNWSAENAGNRAIRAELVDAVFALAGPRLVASTNVLDVGCGTGWWLEHLAADQRNTARLHGLELLPDRAMAAQRQVPSAEIRVGDAGALPFGSGTFDVVTLFTVLSSLGSVGDVERALGEARRVLAPGGALLVWEPRLPTPNRNTIRISQRLIRRALGGAEIETITTTVAPPIARRLGSSTAHLYPRLAEVGVLLTHRLLRARFP